MTMLGRTHTLAESRGRTFQSRECHNECPNYAPLLNVANSVKPVTGSAVGNTEPSTSSVEEEACVETMSHDRKV